MASHNAAIVEKLAKCKSVYALAHEYLNGSKTEMALNRRDFIGAMIASTSLGTLGESLATGQAPSTSGQGEWLTRNGMVDAGGTHEPLIFIVRRGGQRTDALATSRYQQSEELIRKLHQQGVEVFHTSLYKGFGMAAEKEGMEQTREAVAIAHRYGMKADTYVQWGSLMYETFFAEEPRAEQWIERDIAGTSHSAHLWLPAILPLQSLLFPSGIYRLSEKSNSICHRRCENRLHPSG